MLWSKNGDYRVLFSNISERDGGAIIGSLEQLNIPWFSDGGGAILVPGDRVLKSACDLPRGSAQRAVRLDSS